MARIALDQARQIIAAALAHGRELGLKLLTVVDADGVPIGAVGITGDTSDNDEACAFAGIAAAGLTAQNG